MSIRTLLRMLFLAAALAATTPLLWQVVGPLPVLLAACCLLFPAGYLTLIANEPPATRWQLRYDGLPDARLHDILAFLAGRAGHVLVEANAEGLFLEAPRALDRYVAWQLPKAMPNLKLLQRDEQPLAAGRYWLCIGSPSPELLRWATESAGRQVWLHFHAGPYATLTARTEDQSPPGRWLAIPVPSLFLKMWHRLTIWDELSARTPLSDLFPAGDNTAVFSSRPRVMHLVPPDGYHFGEQNRFLGQAADGRAVGIDRSFPLFTVGAPPSFLAHQVMADLERGSVIVVSAHRRTLDLVYRRAAPDIPCHWLDVENTPASAHLAIVAAKRWAAVNLDSVVQTTETFLASLGVDLTLPIFRAVTRCLIRCAAVSARLRNQDFTLEELYSVTQGTRDLRRFLFGLQGLDLDVETRDIARELERQIADDAGYVYAVAALGVVREALRPLGDAAVRALCRPPFVDLQASPGARWLLLAPIPAGLRPDHRRFLGALLDLAMMRILDDAADDTRIALHLHDPHLYSGDAGQNWVVTAGEDPRLAVLIDTHDPVDCGPDFPGGAESSLFFRCSEHAASRLIAIHDLPCTTSDLTELPDGVALAAMPGLVAAVKIGEAL